MFSMVCLISCDKVRILGILVMLSDRCIIYLNIFLQRVIKESMKESTNTGASTSTANTKEMLTGHFEHFEVTRQESQRDESDWNSKTHQTHQKHPQSTKSAQDTKQCTEVNRNEPKTTQDDQNTSNDSMEIEVLDSEGSGDQMETELKVK